MSSMHRTILRAIERKKRGKIKRRKPPQVPVPTPRPVPKQYLQIPDALPAKDTHSARFYKVQSFFIKLALWVEGLFKKKRS